jgi:hypothetical protein
MVAWMFPALGSAAASAATTGSAGYSLAGIGSMLGGLGGFAGGLSSLFGGSSGGYRGRDYKQFVKHRLMTARKYGEEYGFHPLSVLGISPGSVPMHAQSRNNVGNALARMGQGLERMSQSGMTELQKAQVENLKAHTNLLNTQALNRASPKGVSTVSSVPMDETTKAQYEVEPMPKQTAGGGRQLGERGTDVSNWNPEGYYIRTPAEGLEDLVSDDVMAKVRFYAPEWARIVKGWSTHGFESNQDTASAIKYRNATRLYLAGLERDLPPPKGFMYVWSINAGTPRRVPKKKFHRLFDETKKFGMQAEFIPMKKISKWRQTTWDKPIPKKIRRKQLYPGAGF